jgi:hypothetical protein
MSSEYGATSRVRSMLVVVMTQGVWTIRVKVNWWLNAQPVLTLERISPMTGNSFPPNFSEFSEAKSCMVLIYLRFLFTLFLAIDANFKLKNKDRGIKDFELDPGLGCYVEHSRYQSHLASHTDQHEVCLFF